MVAQHWWQRRHPAPPARPGVVTTNSPTPSPATMGVGSLLTPMISTKLLDPVTPTKGRHGKDMQPVAHRHPRVGGDHLDIRGAQWTWRDRVAYLVRGPAGPRRPA